MSVFEFLVGDTATPRLLDRNGMDMTQTSSLITTYIHTHRSRGVHYEQYWQQQQQQGGGADLAGPTGACKQRSVTQPTTPSTITSQRGPSPIPPTTTPIMSAPRLVFEDNVRGRKLAAAIDAAIRGDLPFIRAFIEEDRANLEMVVPVIGEDENKPPFNVTLLVAAVLGKALPVAEYLVDQGADVNAEVLHGGKVVHFACMCSDRLDFLKHFLTRGKADIRAITAQSGTLLHPALYGPHQCLEYIKFLLPFYDGPSFAGPHFSHHDLSTQADFSNYLKPAYMLDTTLCTIVASGPLFKEEGLQKAIMALFLGAGACPFDVLEYHENCPPFISLYPDAPPRIHSMLEVRMCVYVCVYFFDQSITLLLYSV